MAAAFTEKESRLVKAALESVQGGDAALMKLVRTFPNIESLTKSQPIIFSRGTFMCPHGSEVSYSYTLVLYQT